MITKFLKAKHWQIFLITFGLPFLIQIMMMPLMIVGNDPTVMFKVLPMIMILYIGGFFGWFWSIGKGLQAKVPSNINMKVKKFKTFLIIPLIYIILFSIGMSSIVSGSFENGETLNTNMIASIFGIITPLHLFSIFCIFYCLYFVSKTYKTVELQREVAFSDFAGEFFMLWFFPIGIWIIQPKVNKMIEE